MRDIVSRIQKSINKVCTLFAVAIALAVLAPFQSLLAQPVQCPQKMMDRLEAEADGIRNWSKLQSLYHRYRTCNVDDAEVEGGVSESVAKMLADHWETLSVASAIFKRDPKFEAFALLGINITDATEDLQRIDKHAAEQCPADLHVLCQKIRTAVRENR